MVQLPFITKSKEAEDKFLVLDINSSEARCLALYQDKDNLKIIGNGVKSLDAGVARSGFVIDPEAAALAISEATAQANQNQEVPILRTIVAAPTDLCFGLMTTIRSKRPKGKAMDKKESKELYDRLREAAILQAQKDYLETTGDEETDMELITEAVVYSKVDGQATNDILGKTGGLVETAVFNAFSPESYLKTIQTTLRKAGLELLTIAPKSYGMTKAIMGSDVQLHDFVIIEIGTDITSVAVIFGGGILSTRYLNIGTRQFSEGITNKMGLTSREADRLLTSYITGQLTNTETPVIKDAIKDVVDIWLSGMEILFSEYSGVKTFPSKVYLAGKGAEIQDLWNALTNEPWTKSIPFKEPPSYKKLSFLDMNRIADSTGGVTTAEWLPLATQGIVYLEMGGNSDD